ncbi:MAG: hypothetical protein JWN48_3692 [Myxococcaceae bacterium]|nr:hypothetical protein [Myxococcaceae bacterium]
MPTNYEQVAPAYDARYAQTTYPGTTASVLQLVDGSQDVLEVGCGTGHWLAKLCAQGLRVRGVDPARGMLARAQDNAPAAQLLRARAEALPFPEASFDRVLMINTLHHFEAPRRALTEARRVLRQGGKLLVIGLDVPSVQRWSVYDFFPGTRERDLARYPSTDQLQSWMHEAGFSEATSFVAERIEHKLPARRSLAEGRLAKTSTSQLSELSDAAYAAGICAIERAAAQAEAQGETLWVEAQLELLGTCGLC